MFDAHIPGTADTEDLSDQVTGRMYATAVAMLLVTFLFHPGEFRVMIILAPSERLGSPPPKKKFLFLTPIHKMEWGETAAELI